jgi:hypothetical protein
MSVKIDNMGGTTFNTDVLGVARPTPDNTTFAVTCGNVKTFITGFLFPLNFNTGSLIVGTWSNVLANLIKTTNTSATNIRGTVLNIGGASTTVSVLGNTLNINNDFTTILSGVSNMGRFQAGYVTLAVGTTAYIPPNIVSGGSTSVHTTGTSNGITGYGGVTATTISLITNVAQEVNWIYFL